MLATLERLLEIDAADLQTALDQAARLVAEVLCADKVDAFLYDQPSDSLVAMGASATPMARRERTLSLDRFPLATGGRAVEAFRTGTSYLTGRADHDPEEHPDVVHRLGIRSALATPLTVDGKRRGVLFACSARPDHFSALDLRFFEAVARWVGLVARRVELVEWLSAILAQLPSGVLVVDASAQPTLVNDTGRRILGSALDRPASLAEGLARYEVREPITERRLLPEETAIARALDGHRVQSSEVLIRRPGEHEDLWLEVSAAPLRDTSRRVTGAAIIFSDVTRERRLIRDLTATAHEHARLLGELAEREQRLQHLASRLLPARSRALRPVERAELEALTPREREVLRLLGQGLGNDDIARALHLTVGTIKVHVRHILGKLGVATRTQAALRAVELGLVGVGEAKAPSPGVSHLPPKA